MQEFDIPGIGLQKREKLTNEVTREFLGKIELELKKLAGVSPEEALSDAREFVYGEFEVLGHQLAEFNSDELLTHLQERFGSPASIAREYQAHCTPMPKSRKGYAPGWRICCTKCGRSAPAADAGFIRIGAKSIHKYVLGYCSDCRRLRWLRVIQDLEQSNLTEELGIRLTPTEMRSRFHLSPKRLWKFLFPALWLFAIGTFSLPFTVAVGQVQQAKSPKGSMLSFESRMPKGWKVEKTVAVNANQVAAIGKKLGGSISRLANNFLLLEGATLQVNTLECPDSKSTDAVEAALIKVHKGSLPVFRSGNELVEFVGTDLRLIADAKNRLFLDESRTYIVEFDAAPIKACTDDMQWNDFFNLSLALEKDPANADALKKLTAMKSIFAFSDQLHLSEFGNGGKANRYRLNPAGTDELVEDIRTFQCTKLPIKFEVPFVHVAAQIESRTYASRPSKAKISKAGNNHWPVNDPAIVKLADEITAGCKSDEERIEAILKWLQPGVNIKYGGEKVGSRYGVQAALKQRFGRCWDFSDVFITLCRQSGIPCRQVYGWLDKQSGHVWAEVMLKGEIIAYDPTSSLKTTSDYIPFAVSDVGDIPFVYMSSVKIRPQ